MLNDMLQNIEKIYMAYGVTDFRMQAASLARMVKDKFDMNPYNKSAYIFCNKRRDSIKVLCYDKNGFILAQKTLLDTERMRFQWPRNSEEMKYITKQQLDWLLSGLKIEQKYSFKDIEIDWNNIAD